MSFALAERGRERPGGLLAHPVVEPVDGSEAGRLDDPAVRTRFDSGRIGRSPPAAVDLHHGFAVMEPSGGGGRCRRLARRASPSASRTVDLHVRDLLRQPHDLAADPQRVAGLRRAHGLVLHVEGRGPVARLERAVRREVHRRVVDHAEHAAVDDARGVAGERRGRPRRLGPTLAVPVERQPELAEQRHAAVAERALHVTRHGAQGTGGARAGCGAGGNTGAPGHGSPEASPVPADA